MKQKQKKVKQEHFVHYYLKKGPVQYQKRIFTNPFFIIFGILMIIIIISNSIYSFINGKPQKLIGPLDSSSNKCGKDQVKQYPYLYFPSPNPEFLYRTVCIKSCPQTAQDIVQCFPNQKVEQCKMIINPNDLSKQFIVYSSVPYGQYTCLPQSAVYFSRIKNALIRDYEQAFVADISSSFIYLLINVMLTILICVLLLVLLKYYPFQTIISQLIIMILLLFSIAGFCIYHYLQIDNAEKISQQLQDDLQFKDSGFLIKMMKLNNEFKMPYLIIAIFFVIFALIFILFLIRRRKVFKVLTLLVQVTAQFIQKIEIYILIFIIVFISLFSFTFWIVTTFFILSIGQDNNDPFIYPMEKYQAKHKAFSFTIQSLIILYSFSFQNSFINFMISGAVCEWFFFTKKERKQNKNILIPTLQRLYLHLGSIIKASIFFIVLFPLKIIITIKQMIFQKKRKQNQNLQDSYMNKCQRILQIINGNAFVYVHMQGCQLIKASGYIHQLQNLYPKQADILDQFILVLLISLMTIFTFLPSSIMIIVILIQAGQNLNSVGNIIGIFILTSFIVSYVFSLVFTGAASTICVLYLMSQNIKNQQKKNEKLDQNGMGNKRPKKIVEFFDEVKKSIQRQSG